MRRAIVFAVPAYGVALGQSKATLLALHQVFGSGAASSIGPGGGKFLPDGAPGNHNQKNQYRQLYQSSHLFIFPLKIMFGKLSMTS